MLTPHRRPYATQDGYISVIAVSDAHWRRLFEAMGRAALIDDPRFATIAARSDNVDALYGVLTEGMRERTTAEWLEILAALDIPSGPANTLPDLLDDAYLKETAFFQPMRHPLDGDVTITAFPARFSASPPSVRRLWPALGEHTEEVLPRPDAATKTYARSSGADPLRAQHPPQRPSAEQMHVKVRHFLAAVLAHIGEQPIALRLEPEVLATLPTARKKPAISSALALALKSANEHILALRDHQDMTGACGLMSWNASAHSSS